MKILIISTILWMSFGLLGFYLSKNKSKIFRKLIRSKNDQFREYLEEIYWKNDQRLDLKTRCEKVKGYYFSQEIYHDDFYLCEIQTLDHLYFSQIGNVPYCIKMPWGEYNITVQKFGELTDEDVEKAISYVFKQYDSDWLLNVYLDGKQIDTQRSHDYELDSDMLRQTKEMEKRSKHENG